MLKKYIVDLLQENPLNGISTYKDALTLSTGVIIRKIEKMVLTGEEDWFQSADPNNRYLYTDINSGGGYAIQNENICSHFEAKRISVSNDNQGFGVQERQSGTITSILVRYSGVTNTVSGFKTYLQQQYANGTPVTVWYVLISSTTEYITVPTGLSGTVDGYTTQTGTPTPTNPIYPTANTVTMWANYTPSRYNGIAFVTATGQPKQYNGGWS